MEGRKKKCRWWFRRRKWGSGRGKDGGYAICLAFNLSPHMDTTFCLYDSKSWFEVFWHIIILEL